MNTDCARKCDQAVLNGIKTATRRKKGVGRPAAIVEIDCLLEVTRTTLEGERGRVTPSPLRAHNIHPIQINIVTLVKYVFFTSKPHYIFRGHTGVKNLCTKLRQIVEISIE